MLIVYGGAHFVEAYMLQPLIMKRAIRLHLVHVDWEVRCRHLLFHYLFEIAIAAGAVQQEAVFRLVI